MKYIVDKAETRGYFDHGWLKTYHTFSFADYYNPGRMQFGALRVLNDDTVAPGKGFGMHPHNNMEVVSIPLQGYLRHGDNVKNDTYHTPGEIQVMSTGSGMFHSEYNGSMTEVLKFLQIWVVPGVRNTFIRLPLEPNSVKITFDKEPCVCPLSNALWYLCFRDLFYGDFDGQDA